MGPLNKIKKGITMKKMSIGIGVLVVCIGAFSWWYTTRFDKLVAEAKYNITKGLHDPTSVQYRNLYVSKSKDDPNLLVLCGEMNAKNLMGAYSGFHKFFATKFLDTLDDGNEHGLYLMQAPDLCGNKVADVE